MAVVPILYFGGMAFFFFRVGGSMENVSAIGLGPTVLGLGMAVFFFFIPLIIRFMRILPGPRPPLSGGGSDGQDGFDPDAAIARYIASQRSMAQATPSNPAPRPRPMNPAPAKPSGFGRRAR